MRIAVTGGSGAIGRYVCSVFDLRKAERLLGWKPQDRWQDFEQLEF